MSSDTGLVVAMATVSSSGLMHLPGRIRRVLGIGPSGQLLIFGDTHKRLATIVSAVNGLEQPAQKPIRLHRNHPPSVSSWAKPRGRQRVYSDP